jgi:hypothetical protein
MGYLFVESKSIYSGRKFKEKMQHNGPPFENEKL